MDPYAATPAALTSDDPRMWGVVTGIVTNIDDPLGLGRVKTALPWMGEEVESDWARVVTPMAGPGRGIYFRPEINDEVLVAFEHGNPDMPYVLGGLWNGQDAPPVNDQAATNDIRMIKSRSGSTITFNDDENDARIEIIDNSGSNMIVIRASDNSITITADGDITVKAGSGKLTLSGESVDISATSGLNIEATGSMAVKSAGELTVQGSLVKIN
jgi:uncharacterized protein involved in type VI secretion and phage assembly